MSLRLACCGNGSGGLGDHVIVLKKQTKEQLITLVNVVIKTSPFAPSRACLYVHTGYPETAAVRQNLTKRYRN